MKRALFGFIALSIVLLSFFALGDDTKQEVVNLEFNKVYYDSLDPDGDLQDWYKIDIPQTGAFTIMVGIPEKTRYFLAYQRKTVHLYVGIYHRNHLVETLELFQTTKEKNLIQIYAGQSEEGIWYIQVSLQPISTSTHISLSKILPTNYQIFTVLTNDVYHLEAGKFKIFDLYHSPVDLNIKNFFVVLEEGQGQEFDLDMIFLDFDLLNITDCRLSIFTPGFLWCLNPYNYDWIGWRFGKDQIDPFSEEKYLLMGWFYGRNLWMKNMSGTYDARGPYIHVLFSWDIPGYTPVIPDEFYIAIKVVAKKGSGDFWVFSFSVPGFEG
ncbi:hypothetical protein J7K92_01655 [bacterium]|nr:hypothetical protein [bacterium]